jgi:hypothetical protein
MIYVSPEIQRFLDSDHRLASDAQADLESFILGRRVVVALKRDHKDCRMARLDHPDDEVWEIRILDTDPQLRLFGRFAARNTFVALIGPINRDEISGDEDFEAIKRRCKSEWDRLFGLSNRPVRGSKIYDYISEPVRVV